jgi:hypothetical protein
MILYAIVFDSIAKLVLMTGYTPFFSCVKQYEASAAKNIGLPQNICRYALRSIFSVLSTARSVPDSALHSIPTTYTE